MNRVKGPSGTGQAKAKTLSDSLRDESCASASIIRKTVKIGCAVNILLMIAKISIGYLGHSDALTADGFHSLNDIAADLIMLFFVGLSYHAPDKRFPYGYGKFQTFASLLIALLVCFIGAMIIVEGVESIRDYIHGEELPQPDIWTLVVIVLAIGVKESLYRFYHRRGVEADAPALKASAWHHRSDAMASVATLIGVGCAHFFGVGARICDPIASLVIAVFILVPAIRILIPSFGELMERSLPIEEIEKAEDAACRVVGQKNVISVRGRRNGHLALFDIEVKAEPGMSLLEASDIDKQIAENIKSSFCPHAMVWVRIVPDNT